MMHRVILAGMATLLAMLTVSCGSTRPAKYYELQAPAAPAVAANPYPISLLVGRITAPHLFRDDRLVYSSGPEQLGAYAYHRWAEPPDDMIEAMLIEALRASGQYRSVERVSSNARGDYILRGRLISLEEVDKPALAARFALELDLFYPKTGTTVWSQLYSHDEPVTSSNGKKKKVDVAEVIDALNRNVQQGLAQLATALGQFFANHPGP